MEEIKDETSNHLQINTTVAFEIRDHPITAESVITMLDTPVNASDSRKADAESMKTVDVSRIDDSTVATPYSIFTKYQKIMIVFIASFASIIASFTAYIYLPAFVVIQKELHISGDLVSLTIATYMIFQGASPSFWGSLADSWGRRPVYIITNLIYILVCIGLACTKNFAAFLILRMLQAIGTSSSIAIGAGTIGDIASPSERGGYMGIYSMGTTAGQMIGPFLGGVLTHTLGWRWIFWFLSIISCPLWMLQLFFLPETLRKLVGNGSGYANPTPMQYWKRKRMEYNTKDEEITVAGDPISAPLSRYPSISDKSLTKVCSPCTNAAVNPSSAVSKCPLIKISASEQKPKNRFLVLPNPFRSLMYLREKDVALVTFYNSLQYGAMFSILSSVTETFIDAYKINEFQVGLCFLSSGFGSSLGALISGRILDWRFKKIARLMGLSEKDTQRGKLAPEYPIESARMGITWIYGIVFNILVVVYGWCVFCKVHISVPIIINFVLGFTSTATFNATNTLLVDLFPKNSAAIVACNNIPRCFFGGVAVMLVHPGIQYLGVGWYCTALSVVLFISRITIFFELKYGPQWRMERNKRQEKEDKW